MIHEMYSVRDSAVGAFLPPFFVRSKGEAFRAFSSSVNDAGHQFNKYAHDYTLFYLGQYDDNGGMFSSVGSPERVVSAIEVLVDKTVTAPPGQEVDLRPPFASDHIGSNGRTLPPGVKFG